MSKYGPKVSQTQHQPILMSVWWYFYGEWFSMTTTLGQLWAHTCIFSQPEDECPLVWMWEFHKIGHQLNTSPMRPIGSITSNFKLEIKTSAMTVDIQVYSMYYIIIYIVKHLRMSHISKNQPSPCLHLSTGYGLWWHLSLYWTLHTGQGKLTVNNMSNSHGPNSWQQTPWGSPLFSPQPDNAQRIEEIVETRYEHIRL